MNALNKIWKFVNSRIFGYIVIAVVLIILISMCNRNKTLREESNIKDQNISALHDSVNEVILKNGKLEASVASYIGTAKTLRQYNRELAKEVENQKGKVLTLNRIVFRLHNDSAALASMVEELEKKLNAPIQLNDSTWDMGWTVSYKTIGTISGHSIVGIRADKSWLKDIKLFNRDIVISDINIPVSITWGQKWVDGKLKVYAQTSYPGFDTKLLEGTYVDLPKEKHWFNGFGVGPNFSVGYDFLNNKPSVIIGIGIHYNIYRW